MPAKFTPRLSSKGRRIISSLFARTWKEPKLKGSYDKNYDTKKNGDTGKIICSLKVVDGDLGDIDERKSGRRTEGGVPET